ILLLISRKGVESTDPFWMILIFPPCSTTKSRPLPSPDCSSPKGELKPEVTRVNARDGRLEGGMGLLPPHPATRKTKTNKAADNTPILAIACTLLKTSFDHDIPASCCLPGKAGVALHGRPRPDKLEYRSRRGFWDIAQRERRMPRT